MSDYRYIGDMEPATTIIKTLGGAAKVAQIAGVHRTRVYSWMRPVSAGGTGGYIPMRHIPKIIAQAKAEGVDLSGDDFLPTGHTEGGKS